MVGASDLSQMDRQLPPLRRPDSGSPDRIGVIIVITSRNPHKISHPARAVVPEAAGRQEEAAPRVPVAH
ncbi:hypothetical protein GCM10010249_44590 [Streptomyces roseolilacinus]|uniref:Uncharacterized protein n=1 Tax=Streptomyces roseolilacinus TaxID=66904 RepID=A0A918B359_9ACTN|nr:hypothetical protein GCM10010249_44590 [Streptomyces roseolilacinus]